MSARSGVYSIVNKVNGKTYIGQGSNIYQRWRQHRHALSKGAHTNRHLQAAWAHYGADAFAFAIVTEYLPEHLGAEEIKALALVPETLRYNIGVAGNNPTVGLKKRESSKLQQSRSKGGRAFFAEDVTTGIVRRFEHVGEAASAGFYRAHVYTCLHGRRTTHLGHRFFYDPTSISTPKPVTTNTFKEKRSREVIGTSCTTGEELRFAYVSSVEQNNAFKRTGVIKCLAGEMSTHRGYKWHYADGLPHKTMSAENRAKLSVGARKLGGSRTVIGTHKDTGEVVTFPYIRAASKTLNLKPSYIHLVLAGKMLQAGGYVWTYADGLPHNARPRRQ
jgi:group I intron endonuclease